MLKWQNRITKKRQVHGVENRHTTFSQEAVGYTHGLSKTPALPSLVPGCGLPSHLPTGQGPNWGDFSKVGEVMGKRRWGRGSYTATAVRPV